MEEGVEVGVVEVGIVMAAVEDPRQEVHDAEVGQGVEVANDAQEHAVLQVIDLCLEVAGMLFKKINIFHVYILRSFFFITSEKFSFSSHNFRNNNKILFSISAVQ